MRNKTGGGSYGTFESAPFVQRGCSEIKSINGGCIIHLFQPAKRRSPKRTRYIVAFQKAKVI